MSYIDKRTNQRISDSEAQRMRDNGMENFLISAAIGATTNSALIGGILGGDIVGGVVGDILNGGDLFD